MQHPLFGRTPVNKQAALIVSKKKKKIANRKRRVVLGETNLTNASDELRRIAKNQTLEAARKKRLM
jgi:hypothetical protein